MKVRSLTAGFKECREERVKYIDIYQSIHDLGEKLQGHMAKLTERLARVETKVDRLNGGGP